MALLGDDGGKTEKPTPQRLGEARERGQVALSRELLMAGTLLATVFTLQASGGWIVSSLAAALERGMALPTDALHDGETFAVAAHLRASLGDVFGPLALLLAVIVASTLAFGYGQIGVRFAGKALGFKLERLDPLRNLQRVFHPASVVRTLFALVKVGVLAQVVWLVVAPRLDALASLHAAPELGSALAQIADLALAILLWVGWVVLVLAAFDVAWQRWSWIKGLMMTKQEVDDERKRSEGDPLIKGRLRQARLELMKHRMMEAVPKSDVVVTNPTHYAVALRYERGKSPAPEVVAKGADELALRIRELAREHRVPVMEDPPLARALWRSVKVGQTIPERFFRAVAAILSHVYRLQGRVA